MRAWGQPGLLGGSGTALEKDTGTGVTRSHPAAPAFFVCPSRRQKIKRVADLEADFKDTPSCSSPETHIIVCTPPWASTRSQLLPERRTPKGPKQKQLHSIHGRAFCKECLMEVMIQSAPVGKFQDTPPWAIEGVGSLGSSQPPHLPSPNAP